MIYLLPTSSKSVKILYVIIVENHNLSLGPALDIALGLGLELGYLLPLGTQLEYHQGDKLGTSLGLARDSLETRIRTLRQLGSILGDKLKLGTSLGSAAGIVHLYAVNIRKIPLLQQLPVPHQQTQ